MAPEMSTPSYWAHPCYQAAVRLFDMTDWGRGMPSDPHARDGLRDACGRLAAGTDGAGEYLGRVARQYLGTKYRDAVRRDIERIARACAGTAVAWPRD